MSSAGATGRRVCEMYRMQPCRTIRSTTRLSSQYVPAARQDHIGSLPRTRGRERRRRRVLGAVAPRPLPAPPRCDEFDLEPPELLFDQRHRPWGVSLDPLVQESVSCFGTTAASMLMAPVTGPLHDPLLSLTSGGGLRLAGRRNRGPAARGHWKAECGSRGCLILPSRRLMNPATDVSSARKYSSCYRRRKSGPEPR